MGIFSLLADFLMSIYLKIITEENNQNQEKKWPGREKGKNGEKRYFWKKFREQEKNVEEKE